MPAPDRAQSDARQPAPGGGGKVSGQGEVSLPRSRGTSMTAGTSAASAASSCRSQLAGVAGAQSPRTEAFGQAARNPD